MRGILSASSNRPTVRCNTASAMRKGAVHVATAASALLMTLPAHAEGIATFEGSGFLFKDQVNVTAFDDKDIDGVTLYVSEFSRNLVDKLQKDFFTEPSQASLTCAKTGAISIRIDPSKLKDNVEVFSERKSLNLFQDKTLRVRRVYDSQRNTLVYVAYSTRLSTATDDKGVTSGRYRTSICAIPLESKAPEVKAD